MATYYGTYGQKVQYLASDPSDPQIGQVWYNSTSAVLKVRSVTTSGTWATSGNMNQARGAIGSAGTFTAGLAVGAYYPYGNNVEKYNGSVWTNSTAYPVAELAHIGGCGTQTAALMAGGGGTGGNNSTVNKFDGTTWTSATAIPTATEAGNLFGSQTAAIFFGGGTPPGGYPASAFSFNGSSWTASPSLNNSSRYGSLATGTQTAGLAAGGGSPSTSNTEKWNGTSWAASGAVPFVTYNVSGSGVGTQTAAMLWFGSPPNTTTQYFNGSSWSNQSATLTYGPMGGKAASGGTQSAAFSGSGDPGKSVATTNNWTGAGVATTRTVTVS